MECPAPKKRGNLSEIHVFASDASMITVEKKIISLLKRDITYLVGGGTFRNDLKILYWNDGYSGYEKGLKEYWRN